MSCLLLIGSKEYTDSNSIQFRNQNMLVLEYTDMVSAVVKKDTDTLYGR